MTTDAWFKMLFVSLVVLGFTLPFMVYFVDVYKGRQVFPIPIMGPIKRLLVVCFGSMPREQGASAEPPKSAH